MKSPFCFLLTFFSLALGVPSLQAEPPNIVFMLVDDMGTADLSSYGSPDAQTPNIDQLAAEGIRFTQVYANGTECTPSRTAILTGRYAQRAGGLECAIGTGNVGRYDEAIALAEKGELGLPASQAVLAPALKDAGYTNAVYGKWHMGYEPKFNPLDQGFDEFRGFLGGNVDYFRHRETSPLEVLINGREPEGERGGYMTHHITDDSIQFIEAQKETDNPFFLYVAFSTPHFPFQGPNDDTGEMHPLDEWTTGTREKYLELIHDMDFSVGRILDALKEHGLEDNTLVVFASDHGGMAPALNSPFRDYKGTTFEGGIRVPCVVKWPNGLPQGVESEQVGTLMDLTTSFLNLADAEVPDGKPLDGIDLLQHVKDGKPLTDRTLAWRGKRGERTWQAIRSGDWKYVRKTEGESEEWLFDLGEDVSEENNLLSAHPERAADLKEKLAAWEEDVAPIRP